MECRLVFGLPQRVIARLPDSLSLSGRTLTQLIPIVWRNYARAGLEPSASAESGTSDGNADADADADTTKPQPLKEVCSLATLRDSHYSFRAYSCVVCCVCVLCVCDSRRT
jgi:hypothetical protein